jgi:hypothetical protein
MYESGEEQLYVEMGWKSAGEKLTPAQTHDVDHGHCARDAVLERAQCARVLLLLLHLHSQPIQLEVGANFVEYVPTLRHLLEALERWGLLAHEATDQSDGLDWDQLITKQEEVGWNAALVA